MDVVQGREAGAELRRLRGNDMRIAAQSFDDEAGEFGHVGRRHAPSHDLGCAESQSGPFVSTRQANRAGQDVGVAQPQRGLMSAAVIPQRTISGVPSRSPDHSSPPGKPIAQAKMLASRNRSAAW